MITIIYHFTVLISTFFLFCVLKVDGDSLESFVATLGIKLLALFSTIFAVISILQHFEFITLTIN